MQRARTLVTATLAVALLGGCSPSGRGPATSSTPSTLPSGVGPRSPAPSPSPTSAQSATVGSSPVPGPVWVPGTHVSIVPPPRFEPTTEGAGFRDVAGDAEMSIQELPGGPYDRTDAGYARAGLVVEHREQTTIDGQVRILVQGVQTLPDDTQVYSILLSLGSAEMSTLIVAQHALGDAEAHQAILAALETVRLDPARGIEPGMAIAFDVTPAPPLQLAGMLGQGAVYNTLGRLHHPPDAAIPTMSVYVYSAPAPGDAADFLRGQLERNGQQLFRPRVELAADVTIDGLEGFEITASALDALESTDRELVAYLLFVPGPKRDRYVYMSAIATADVRDELLPAFRDTALSFRWREAP